MTSLGCQLILVSGHMASIIWSLLLFLAQLHTPCFTSASQAHADNLTRLSVPILCRPDQAHALLQLKKSFSFGKSTPTLPSWRDGTDCCFWEGVGCDASSGNITVLDLNNRGLSSYDLHPAIFNLTSLRRLDLSMNYFGLNWNNIPSTGFERFALLTHLNLSNLGIQGPVPIGIGKLVNLLSLDISTSFDNLIHFEETYDHHSNNLYESNFDTLVANLSSLRELYLDNVDLSRNGEELYISLATSVPHLEVLSLAFCRLEGPVHKSLSRLHSLMVINLQGNEIVGPFPEFFMDFLNLTVLQLSETSLEGLFPSRSFKSENLRVLDLSNNYGGLSGYVPNFSNESSLEILRLEGTDFSSAKPFISRNFRLLKELSLNGNIVSVDFLSSLGSLGSLQQLLLGFGSLGELGSIFTWLGDRKNLTSLVLEGCDFSMTTPSSVVSSFKTLRTLTMYDCNLPRSVVSAIGNLMDLRTLEMEFCTTYGSILSSFGNLTNMIKMQIHSPGSVPMPTTIGNLTNLHTMVIQCDDPGGYTSGTIPYTIGQLDNLRLLDLNGCYSGRIPSSIANLTQLTGLHLSNNAFNGEVPSSIFTILVLRDLDLSWNQLSGPIPEFNQALSQLEIVELRNNKFSGPIPRTFFQLTSLVLLDLRSNNLIGLVDLSSFWKLRNIEILHLSNNKLSVMDGEGTLPSAHWSGPHVLGLVSCNITQFPRSLLRSKYISYLDLSCNKISGDIPKQVWEICSSTITYLNISHNMFTSIGLTSDVFPFTTVLYVFDLSFNRLRGCAPMPNSSAQFLDYSNNLFSSVLPNWVSYLSYTKYLSMSRNSINGCIPFSICNAVLDVLDLSYNNLSGPIPSCIIETGQLGVLNLRKNHFEGTLPSNIATSCSLQTLDLHGNKIQGLLPRALSHCTDLEILDVGGNRMADIFPSWLMGFSNLRVLVLRSNQFYGTIDDTDGDTKPKEYFPSLQIMDLASNNFSGSLRSQWFERLKMMTSKLNSSGEILFHRNFTDQFYRDSIEISYKGSDMVFERILTTLTAIDFSSNRLEGVIPESIGRLVSLHVLNLSHNAFTGKIPAQVGGMTDLESLDLSGNQLSGQIPQELTNLPFVDVLNLSNNHLVGKIPQARQFSTFDSSSFGGNSGLCGPPLSESPCGASAFSPGVYSPNVDVVLFLFVGLGFGVGFAAAIVVKLGRIGRWFNVTARASRT